MAIATTTLSPSRRSSKRALAVRMMVAETAWLDGEPRWHGGRVAWASQGRLLTPGASDLALAQRRLYKIRRYPISADLVLGDSAAWAARRRERLELAKRLRAIVAPDIRALERQARAHDPNAAQRLAELLIAEAVCLNSLPVSPAAALLACGQRAQAALAALLADNTAPLPSRALAALTLGASHSAENQHLRINSSQASGSQFLVLGSDLWLRRAYSYGLSNGLTPTPALTAALLAVEEGPSVARRCERALQAAGAFRLAPELLRELLAQGMAPARVTALAEAAAHAEPLAERILRRRAELPERPASQRRAMAAELLSQRRQLLADLAELLHSYARASADPLLIEEVVTFTSRMLDLAPPTRPLADAITLVLRHALELPAELRRPALELLNGLHTHLWDRATTPSGKQARNPTAWLQNRWTEHAQPTLALLRATGDAAITREAAELGVQLRLGRMGWREPGMYRLALALVRDNELAGVRHTIDMLLECLGMFEHAGAARAALLPLSQVLAPLDHGTRVHLWDNVLEALPRSRQALGAILWPLARFLPRLIKFNEGDQSEWCLCRPLIDCAVSLYAALPDQADTWLDWLLAHTAEATAKRSYQDIGAIDTGLRLALALSAGDFSAFQSVFAAARKHDLSQDRWTLRPGLDMLRRWPALRTTIARLFPQQPRRCVELIVRLGSTAQLGADVLAPLDELKPEPSAEQPELAYDGWYWALGSRCSLVSGWHDLLELAPELVSPAAAYQYAQWLLGRRQDVPAGVRRALEQPRKLAGELAYLERTLINHPERADLAIRAASLRGRLANQEQLAHNVRAEASERLLQATAEAQLAAAEAQVLACFRARLGSVVGTPPDGLELGEDLLNATLLTSDVSQNRRLLLRLLRAHLAGESSWREQHPANAAFLSKLLAQGVDTAAWLEEHARTYRCDGFVGGRVRLHLERNPLRILQMGNYMQTCLSVGGGNAFSAVANACELNKRVVYATDGAGHVVARKLVAINAEGRLVGFHTYTTLGEAESSQLRAIFPRYLRDFAAHCGLGMADDGVVPTLFAEAWYDDGCVAWDADQPQAGQSTEVAQLIAHSHAGSRGSRPRAQARGVSRCP
jgi:hypothetical protein